MKLGDFLSNRQARKTGRFEPSDAHKELAPRGQISTAPHAVAVQCWWLRQAFCRPRCMRHRAWRLRGTDHPTNVCLEGPCARISRTVSRARCFWIGWTWIRRGGSFRRRKTDGQGKIFLLPTDGEVRAGDERGFNNGVAIGLQLQISGYMYDTSRCFLLITVLYIGLLSQHPKSSSEAIFSFWLSCSKRAFSSVSDFK
ncbi:hypothetical protein CRG98_021988, partial [Punica granatum]